MADKILRCKDCGAEFTFTESEQQFYAEKGFTNEPGRCPDCRRARKQQNRGGYGDRNRERVMYSAICAECGCETQVPFQPREDRPVYCRDCYAKHSNSYSHGNRGSSSRYAARY
ncbi:MAG: zinc-binding protein [Firmicutes bacterium]|nr:zinc-binding protein [Bacillota bacterium]